MGTKNNVAVQIYKDGNRTILVIDGSTASLDELILKLVGTAVPNAEASVEEVDGLEPAASIVEKAPDITQCLSYVDYISRNQNVISTGLYKGMTATEAIFRDGPKALAELFLLLKGRKNLPERDSIASECRRYMMELPYETDKWNREQKASLIVQTDRWLNIDLFTNGYRNAADFAQEATDGELRAATENLALALADRAKKQQ